jgi:ubiquinone/menaquinone biosynthesis C-methylase UbiE
MKRSLSFRLRFSWAAIAVSCRLGPIADFLHHIPVAILPAEELSRLTSGYYAQEDVIRGWSENAKFGLNEGEAEFIKKRAFPRARILVIAGGAGRESIALAKQGYEVTALEQSAQMVEAGKRLSQCAGVNVVYFQQDMNDLSETGETFDLILVGLSYGLIPTQERRIVFLKKINSHLSTQGSVYISGQLETDSFLRKVQYGLYRLIAFATGGNLGCQPGDRIHGAGEFYHHFTFPAEIANECLQAGFITEASRAEANAFFCRKLRGVAGDH